jgi:hypothetical protein
VPLSAGVPSALGTERTGARDTGREQARAAAMLRIELGHDCGACIPALASNREEFS